MKFNRNTLLILATLSTVVSASSALAQTAGSWTKCANEYANCNFPKSGTYQVLYGVSTTSRYVIKTISNAANVYCSNGTFGDPASGVGKSCFYMASAATVPTPTPAATPTVPVETGSWVSCSNEWGTCTFTGTRRVLYGVSTSSKNVIKTFTGSAACNNNIFGDPAAGSGKQCWYEASTREPASTPTPAPTATPVPTATPAQVPVPSGTAAGPRVSIFVNSAPITAKSGQVISGVRISNMNGNCITIPAGVVNVVVRDSVIGPCRGTAHIYVAGAGALIEHNQVYDGKRGIMVNKANNVTVRKNVMQGPFAPYDTERNSAAIEVDYSLYGVVDGNIVRGFSNGDAISFFMSSNSKLINNDVDVTIGGDGHGAPLTMGDAGPNQDPGHDNYIAGNVVRQSGGVASGLFGSSGNTLIEKNCFASGIQAYTYNDHPMEGVTIRLNVINKNGSYVPDTSILMGWSTNVFGSDCSKIP